MGIITYNSTATQQETLTSVFHKLPIVLVNGDADVYILVKDLSEDMENFIYTGRVESDDLSVFSAEYEQYLISQCQLAGFKYTYRSQPLEYMHKKIKIRYLQVLNPKTDVIISFVPWFFLKDHPYPNFLYLYAIWHYNSTNRNSMEFSATIAGELFGVNTFHKSTICRNIKKMEVLFGDICMNSPLSVTEPPVQSTSETISQVTEFLKKCPSIESLIKLLKVKTARCHHSAESCGMVSRVLGQIPNELSKVTKETASVIKGSIDTRRRPTRSRKKKPTEKKRLAYVESYKMERIRKSFISSCKAIILDAAITYHRLII